MAITKFNQLYTNMKKVLGKDRTDELFPEYNANFSSKMPQLEQIKISQAVMRRLDENVSEEQILLIRRACSCNIPKFDLIRIDESKK